MSSPKGERNWWVGGFPGPIGAVPGWSGGGCGPSGGIYGAFVAGVQQRCGQRPLLCHFQLVQGYLGIVTVGLPEFDMELAEAR